ncbi:hypothetical protein AB395_00001965 [Sinorhizobium fredii CCBAU 45436]|nr:hypothetical protein AB395_00001965 [Sinorhizobium fredii CCBAU 45436]
MVAGAWTLTDARAGTAGAADSLQDERTSGSIARNKQR